WWQTPLQNAEACRKPPNSPVPESQLTLGEFLPGLPHWHFRSAARLSLKSKLQTDFLLHAVHFLAFRKCRVQKSNQNGFSVHVVNGKYGCGRLQTVKPHPPCVPVFWGRR